MILFYSSIAHCASVLLCLSFFHSLCLNSYFFSDKSILGYFKSNNYTEAYNVFFSTLQTQTPSFTAPDPSVHYDLLDKKWNSILKLNKKIMELEGQVQQLKEDLENSTSNKGKKVDQSAVLPRDQAKYTLKGHRDGVRAVKFHPTYSILATASEDATIKIWDYESGKLERTLQGHQDSVNDIDFNSAGTLLVSCSADLSLKLWNFESNEYSCLKTLHGHDHSVSGVCFLASGDQLLSCSRDKSIKLWEVSTGYCLKTYTSHEQWVRTITLSPVTSIFASGSMDHSIKLWNIQSGEVIKTLNQHEHVVECLAFSNPLADQFIQTLRQEESKNNGINGTQLNGNSTTSTSSSSSSSSSSSTSSTSTSSSSTSSSAPSSAGGLYLASGSRDCSIRIWDVQSGVCIATLIGHDSWLNSVLFHPCGRYLLSCSDDKSIRCWDISKNWKQCKKISEAHEGFVSCLSWNRFNQPLLASGGVDNTAKIWECK